MFVRSAAAAALERKKELFSVYERNRQEEQKRMKGWLQELKAESAASLNSRLDAIDNPWPGALPTAEFDCAAGMRIPLGARWQNREQARHWALQALDGRPVLAVDGSQIVPTTDYSPPVGAVQIGWFFNDRRPAMDSDSTGHYEKDIDFEVLAPDELLDSGGDDGVFPNWRVNQQRFILECAKLCEFMERCAERPFARRPVCFFDGSLIISFAGQLRAGREHGYIQAVQELLDFEVLAAPSVRRRLWSAMWTTPTAATLSLCWQRCMVCRRRRTSTTLPYWRQPCPTGGSQPILGMRTPGPSQH